MKVKENTKAPTFKLSGTKDTKFDLKKAKERFYLDGALYASMTGTGSTIYGIFNK